MKTIQTQVIFAALLVMTASLMTASAAMTATGGQEAVGRITAASGVTSVQRAGSQVMVGGDAAVYEGSQLISGEQGYFQLAMGNGAYVVLFPHSSLALAGNDGDGFSYRLNAGMAHIITNNTAQLMSPTGTVATTGADFANMECDGTCFHTSGAPYPDGLYVWVKSGNATITTNAVATASLAHHAPVLLAYAGATQNQISDVGGLRLAAADGGAGSGISATAGTVVFAAPGAAPIVLSSVPDFFIGASFETQVEFPQPKRITGGIGIGVTAPDNGGGGNVVPVSPN